MRSRNHILLIMGIIPLTLIAALTVIGIWYTPHSPSQMQVRDRFRPPSSEHWFGTDQFGRDLFSRIMQGGQTTLAVGIAAVSVGLAVGTALGAISGYYGSRWDEILMRVADGLYAFPAFLLALLAVTIVGPGRQTVLAAIAIANVPIFMRISRANFTKLRTAAYVDAARAIGASDLRIAVRHILPNVVTPLLVQASASFAASVLAEASLSYLGVGIQPPLASWGRMLREAQSFAGLAPWTVVFPGLAIALTILGLNLVGDGIQQTRSQRQGLPSNSPKD